MTIAGNCWRLLSCSFMQFLNKFTLQSWSKNGFCWNFFKYSDLISWIQVGRILKLGVDGGVVYIHCFMYPKRKSTLESGQANVETERRLLNTINHARQIVCKKKRTNKKPLKGNLLRELQRFFTLYKKIYSIIMLSVSFSMSVGCWTKTSGWCYYCWRDD